MITYSLTHSLTSMFTKRAKRNKAGSRVWRSTCGRYEVVAYESCYGVRLRPVWFVAWWRDRDGVWRKLSQHRRRERADLACERHRGRLKSPLP